MIEQVLIMLPLVCGAYLTLTLLKLPDFSLESAYLGGAAIAYLAENLSFPLPLIFALGGGAAVGALVYLIHHYLRIPYLLTAIAVNGLTHGCVLWILNGAVKGFHPAVSETALLIAAPLLVLLLLFFLLRSQIGYALAIYGHNPHFLNHHKISQKFVLAFGIVLAYALAGLSGFLFSLTSGVVDLSMSFGTLMLCLTALMIGKQALKGSKPSLLVPLLGVIAFFLMQQLLLRAGLDLKYYNAFQALVVLFILKLEAK